VQVPGATRDIAPPRICQEKLNIAKAPQENDEIVFLPKISPPTSKGIFTPGQFRLAFV